MPVRHRPTLAAALLVLAALAAGAAPAPAQEPAAGGITGDGRPGGGDSEGSGGDSQGGDSGEPAALGATGGAPAATEGGLPRERVRLTQERLAAAGFDPGPADGAVGPRTRAAQRAFQEARGLDPTGEPDGSTLGELGVE
jgi:peptidoglycan hydrolase-like protein with peptidoglycan-binding domain